jgi:hypothetical protein
VDLAKLIATLKRRKALIVHCSRPGKGNEDPDALMFPDDLKAAMDGAAQRTGGLSCSLAWPDHCRTFGSVGIILRPRSIASITEICVEDAGSERDKVTGRRTSRGATGKPFSAEAVQETFVHVKSYNEWIVDDADTIGIFVNLQEGPIRVPVWSTLEEVEGYESDNPYMSQVRQSYPAERTLEEVVACFPGVRVFAFLGQQIIRIGVSPSEVYRLRRPKGNKPPLR